MKNTYAFLVLVLLLAIVPPATAQGSDPFEPALIDLIPKLVPWQMPTQDTPGQFFIGIAYPEPDDNGMVFALDGVMTTLTGHNYYGIGLSLRVANPSTLQLKWQHPQFGVRDVVQLGGEGCEPVDQRRLSQDALEGLRQTGRESPGAVGLSQDRMDANQPAFMYDCAASIEEQFYERRIRVLIPESLIQISGRLHITAIYSPPNLFCENFPTALGCSCIQIPCAEPVLQPEPIRSPVLTVNLKRNVPDLLILGDSVAWGQGIPEDRKVGGQVFRHMQDLYGEVRFVNRAHSGAIVNHPGINQIADANPEDCLFMRELGGEIPRSDPTVQCQILDAVTQECFVSQQDIGVVPIPHFFCVEGLPRRAISSGELRFDFSRGPAIDVVIMWACANDIGAFNIIAGGTGLPGDLAVLRGNTRFECNLRNGLRDIREFLPNARILVNEYHRIISRQTNPDRSGCPIQEASVIFAAMLGGVVGSAGGGTVGGITGGIAGGGFVFFASDELINIAADRSNTFRNESSGALRRAIRELNEPPSKQEPRGRGSLSFVEHSIYDDPRTAIWASSVFSLVFGLRCIGSDILRAIDDPVQVRNPRIDECARVHDTARQNPFRLEVSAFRFMTCVRASAFHPNVAGNDAMAFDIIAEFQRYYPRTINFDRSNPEMVNPEGDIP